VAPAKGTNNEQASVNGRVLHVGNNRVPTDTRIAGWVIEFMDKLLGGKEHTLQPLSLEEVKVLQDGRAQRERAERNFNWDSEVAAERAKGSCFVKAEAYAQPNDPRNITTTETSHMQDMSGYMYSFKKTFLKCQKWYSPGMTPVQVADRVCEIAAHNDVLVETDFSRFDGTISPWLSGVVCSIYERAFPRNKRDHIRKLWESEVVAACRTKGGVRFRAAGSRLSGSPQTTDGNTIINALFTYIAFRFSGYSADEAWKRLGLYCGDDGLSNCEPDALQWTASQLGLKIEVIVREKYGPVGYLGRVFVDPWTTVVSVQDPMRTMAKIHITTADSTIPLPVAATWRAQGYLQMDPHAPVVAEYCRYIIRVHGEEYAAWMAKQTGKSENRKKMLEEAKVGEMPYWVRGEVASWPTLEDGSDSQAIAWRVAAEQFGVDESELKALEDEISEACTLYGSNPVTAWKHRIENARTSKLQCELIRPHQGNLLIGKPPVAPPPQAEESDVKANFDLARQEVGGARKPPVTGPMHEHCRLDDTRQEHSHHCQKCNELYTHNHIIQKSVTAREARAKKYRQLCHRCIRSDRSVKSPA
jgi:hypothetical protein